MIRPWKRRRTGSGALSAAAAPVRRGRNDEITSHPSLQDGERGGQARGVILGLCVASAVGILWAAVTPVSEVTTGAGTLRTEVEPERIEHADGGRVAQVHVHAGQQVQKGDPIVSFEIDGVERRLTALEARRHALALEEARLSFVLEGGTATPSWPDAASAHRMFWVERRHLDAQLDILAENARAITSAVASMQARRAGHLREVDILAEQMSRMEQGGSRGILARIEIETRQRERIAAERALAEIDAEIAAKRSELTLNRLEESRLLAERERTAVLRLAEVEEERTAVEQDIMELEARKARAVARASTSGTIMDLAVAGRGEVVAAGDPIATVVQTSSGMEAEIEVPADRIGDVDQGMPARIKVATYDFTRYGAIMGKVTRISPTSYETEEGVSVFRVTVQLEEDRLAPAGQALRPGMTVAADFIADEKTVLSYMLKPLRALGDGAFTEG